MNNRPPPTWIPALGCLTVLAAFCLLCLLPIYLVDVMHTALARLHLSSTMASLAVLGILLGSFVNIPVHRFTRETAQPAPVLSAFGIWSPETHLDRLRHETVIAVNLGGCIIPLLLAVWQLVHLVGVGGWPLTALAVIAWINIVVCYRASRPIAGVGIAMPGFLSPLCAVGLTWVLMYGGQYSAERAPVAFIAGVAGPLVGADLLRLRDITRVSVGMLSIGGAGTFDGIVLSGVLAALLA
jgi:uncharacterized membrane protein